MVTPSFSSGTLPQSGKSTFPRDVFVVSAVRTPIGRRGGSLSQAHPADLLAQTLEYLMQTVPSVPKVAVEDVKCGCVTQVKTQGANVARLATLKANFPHTVPAITMTRLCGSSEASIHACADAVGAGTVEIAIACGVECMSSVPMFGDTDLGDPKPSATTERFKASAPTPLLHQGESADRVAAKYGLSRPVCDAWAERSHARALKAGKTGVFAKQLVPVTVADHRTGAIRTMAQDEGPRKGTTAAKLSKLRILFTRDGVVHAGNASQISDGAAAVMLASGDACRKYGLKPLARVVATVAIGSDPVLMLDGPIEASRRVLKRAGHSVDDMDVVEINEAFAPVVCSWVKELKPANVDLVNPNGGAIAHGHPLGATGAVLATKLVHELARRGGRFGLQTMCIGHGQATATIFENVSDASWYNGGVKM